MPAQPGAHAGPNFLFDHLIERFRLKNDADLARVLQVAPSVISKTRRLRLRIGDVLLLNMHETFNMPVADMRVLGDIVRVRSGTVAAKLPSAA